MELKSNVEYYDIWIAVTIKLVYKMKKVYGANKNAQLQKILKKKQKLGLN